MTQGPTLSDRDTQEIGTSSFQLDILAVCLSPPSVFFSPSLCLYPLVPRLLSD